MYTHVEPCKAIYSHVLPCIAMYTHVYPCIAMRWLDTVFHGQYLPSLSQKLRRHKQSFGKIAIKVVLDEDENLI